MLEGPAEHLLPLQAESGGHRWQRVPPTERRGRVHTSTVTVAALPLPETHDFTLKDSDIEVFTTRDTGTGGQHRNTTDSCVVMRHRPSGIEAKAAGRSQHQNRRVARALLEARVTAEREEQKRRRRELIGSGMRGDKIRTYRQKDDLVTDHRTGSKARLSQLVKGRGTQKASGGLPPAVPRGVIC